MRLWLKALLQELQNLIECVHDSAMVIRIWTLERCNIHVTQLSRNEWQLLWFFRVTTTVVFSSSCFASYIEGRFASHFIGYIIFKSNQVWTFEYHKFRWCSDILCGIADVSEWRTVLSQQTLWLWPKHTCPHAIHDGLITIHHPDFKVTINEQLSKCLLLNNWCHKQSKRGMWYAFVAWCRSGRYVPLVGCDVKPTTQPPNHHCKLPLSLALGRLEGVWELDLTSGGCFTGTKDLWWIPSAPVIWNLPKITTLGSLCITGLHFHNNMMMKMFGNAVNR